MSIRISSAIWTKAPYQGKELLLLLAMADFANDEGFFFASQSTLAQKARCSVEYVRQCVQGWVESGVLEVLRKGHSAGMATEYRLTSKAIEAVDNQSEGSPTQLGSVDKGPQPSWGELPNSSRKLPNSTQQQPYLQRNETKAHLKVIHNKKPVAYCETHSFMVLPCISCAADLKVRKAE